MRKVVFCYLGVYRQREVCQNFGNVLNKMMLGNRLLFCSVSSDKPHFELGVKDMFGIERKYDNVLERLITEKLKITEFGKAFLSKGTGIKAIICFR